MARHFKEPAEQPRRVPLDLPEIGAEPSGTTRASYAAPRQESGTASYTAPRLDTGASASYTTARPATSTLTASRASGSSRGGKRSIVRTISNVLMIVGVGMLIAAGVMWGMAQFRYIQQDQENERLAQFATVYDAEGTADESRPPEIDWAGLRAINPDAVAWIQIPGTVINYPVYQGDDNEYYLDTNAEGQYGVGGQIFMDYVNTAPGMIDQQTIIYGHHLKNGAMFKQVADMENQEFFNSIRTVWFVTEDASYELMPLFVYYTNPYDTNVRIFNFSSPDEYHVYLMNLLANSTASNPNAAQIITRSSHVLTLGTCNYIDGYGRTMLVCVPKADAEGIG